MNDCAFEQKVERWFDGERENTAAVEQHLAACAGCRDYVAFLETARAVSQRADRPEIADAQMPAFMAGIREGAQAQREPWGRRVLAGLSLVTAALIVTISLISIFTPAPPPAAADTVVESSSTDIEGATTESYLSDDGNAVVWVNVPEGDMW